MRDKIEEALKTIDLPVEYGVGSKLENRDSADFILFNQRGIRINGHGDDFSLECIYRIIICKENFIDDELVQDVILALKDIPGMLKENARVVESLGDDTLLAIMGV